MVVIVTFFTASMVLAATVVTAAPINDEHRLISKEVPFPSEGSFSENDIEVQELHSLDTKIESTLSTTEATHDAHSLPLEKQTNDDEKRSSDIKSDFILSDFTSSSDTPRDMAEYIFWTGDETSVSAAIKDFVDQGLLSVDDGKVFMEEVRYNLHQIQLRYGTVTEKAESRLDRAKYAANQVEDGDEESRQLSALTTVNQAVPSGDDKHHAGEIVVTSFSPQNKSESQLVSSKPEQAVDELEEEIKTRAAITTASKSIKDEHLNEAHIVDLLNNEYSLEEIIYQLARILFSQSLSQAGHPEAEEALKKFADFLEKESKEGKMSPQVQKKVLDVLLMSLFDAMGDHGQPNVSPSVAPLKSNPKEVSGN